MAKDSKQKLTTMQAVAPFAIAAVCLLLATMLWLLRSDMSDAENVLFGILFTVLVFDLPVCFLILIGHPPVMTLSPLLPTEEERAFHRALRIRPPLSDDEFIARFYAEPDIPRDVPVRLRRELEAELEVDLASIHPQDNIAFADEDLDFADVIYRIERAFQIRIPLEECGSEIDGTFDSLVRCICRKKATR